MRKIWKSYKPSNHSRRLANTSLMIQIDKRRAKSIQIGQVIDREYDQQSFYFEHVHLNRKQVGEIVDMLGKWLFEHDQQEDQKRGAQ